MDNDLVLNIAVDTAPSNRFAGLQKGGRWIDRCLFIYYLFIIIYLHTQCRLKVKRSRKRKARTDNFLSVGAPTRSEDIQPPPHKKARTDDQQATHTPSHSQRPTQIISSLFSFNPKVVQPIQEQRTSETISPSNAPLDSSTFPGLGLNPLLTSHLANKMGIQKPTAVQQASLTVLLSDLASSRDVFLQSQTGSGKTLAYLLPIVQDLLPLSSLSYIDRSIGTLAVIIAPTRELARQISDVVDALLKLRLRPVSESITEPDTATRLTRWLVPGLLIGGATRTHEKAKLRKGVPILVSTPGRLLDHLQNTSSFDVGKCRWLILDEADQLMELGFEDTIKGIIQALDGRSRLAKQANAEGRNAEVAGGDWERRRRTILCSATIREDVQKLAGTALVDPLVIRAAELDKNVNLPRTTGNFTTDLPSKSLSPPSQLLQKYIVVPLKLRLVTLIALLRMLISQTVQKGFKIIVFLSCTDSVDFHWRLFSDFAMGQSDSNNLSDKFSEEEELDCMHSIKSDPDKVEAKCALLPGVPIYRLHGSLTTHARLAALRGFSGNKTKGSVTSVLFCTSVASRGLDLPLVRAVIQYDLPTEGGGTEYIHRVGRTARAGKGGEAWSFVAPSEVGWVNRMQDKMRGEKNKVDSNISLSSVTVEEVLGAGFGGKRSDYEERATEVQLSFERWVLQSKEVSFFSLQSVICS